MLTITNKLDTCLVIPEGQEKGALFLDPKGKAKVKEISASLKEAERNGLVSIGYPIKKHKYKANSNKPRTERQENK